MKGYAYGRELPLNSRNRTMALKEQGKQVVVCVITFLFFIYLALNCHFFETRISARRLVSILRNVQGQQEKAEALADKHGLADVQLSNGPRSINR